MIRKVDVLARFAFALTYQCPHRVENTFEDGGNSIRKIATGPPTVAPAWADHQHQDDKRYRTYCKNGVARVERKRRRSIYLRSSHKTTAVRFVILSFQLYLNTISSSRSREAHLIV